MKFLIVALCALSCAFAAEDGKAEVLKSEYDANPDGGYHYAYETSNGIQAQAEAALKTIDKDKVALEVHGSNQFQSPEGKTFKLTFVADENGYQPQGDHLPTPPAPMPIPDYILKAIEYTKAHPYDEKKAKN